MRGSTSLQNQVSARFSSVLLGDSGCERDRNGSLIVTKTFLNRVGIGTAYDQVESSPGSRVGRPPLGGRHAVRRRSGRGAHAAHDAGGEGRPARQPLDRRRAFRSIGADRGLGRGGVAGSDPECCTDARRVRRRRQGLAGGGEPARPRASDSGLRKRTGDPRAGRGGVGAPAARGARCVAAGHPCARARGMPDRVHHLRSNCVSGRHRLGRDVRPRARGADGGGDRARHGRARCTPGFVPRA